MYNEVVKTRKGPGLWAVAAVVLGFFAISLLNLFDLDMRWLYEFAILVLMCAAVYGIIRHALSEYKYMLIGGELIVKHVLGSRERILAVVKSKNIRALAVEPEELPEEYKRIRGLKCWAGMPAPRETLRRCSIVYSFMGELARIDILASEKLVGMIRGEMNEAKNEA